MNLVLKLPYLYLLVKYIIAFIFSLRQLATTPEAFWRPMNVHGIGEKDDGEGKNLISPVYNMDTSFVSLTCAPCDDLQQDQQDAIDRSRTSRTPNLGFAVVFQTPRSESMMSA